MRMRVLERLVPVPVSVRLRTLLASVEVVMVFVVDVRMEVLDRIVTVAVAM